MRRGVELIVLPGIEIDSYNIVTSDSLMDAVRDWLRAE
jgi:hypothetical protein